MRNVSLAHVIVKLQFTDGVFYLLHKNRTWNDWNLIGGHVEAGEEDEWVRTAYREAQEEMSPLLPHRDFFLVPLLTAPISWGPRKSRSAGEALTTYRANLFRLIFRQDPSDFLSHRLGEDFMLVTESELDQRGDISNTVKDLYRNLPHGLAALPLAWPWMPRSHACQAESEFAAAMSG